MEKSERDCNRKGKVLKNGGMGRQIGDCENHLGKEKARTKMQTKMGERRRK